MQNPKIGVETLFPKLIFAPENTQTKVEKMQQMAETLWESVVSHFVFENSASRAVI